MQQKETQNMRYMGFLRSRSCVQTVFGKETNNMADITMCGKEDCPVRKACYRATAIADERWQSYAIFTDCNEDNDYEDFLGEPPTYE